MTSHQIAESLLELAVPIESLSPYPGNPRRGDIEAIATSLAEHGQYKAVVVQESSGHVLAGNHTLAAARHLGWDQIAAVHLDVDDATARRIVATDNRSADLGGYDDRALAELLQQIAADETGLEGTGYRDDDLEMLLEGLADEYLPEGGDAPQDELQQAWGVIVTARDEAQQVELLNKFEAEGLTVRALML